MTAAVEGLSSLGKRSTPELLHATPYEDKAPPITMSHSSETSSPLSSAPPSPILSPLHPGPGNDYEERTRSSYSFIPSVPDPSTSKLRSDPSSLLNPAKTTITLQSWYKKSIKEENARNTTGRSKAIELVELSAPKKECPINLKGSNDRLKMEEEEKELEARLDLLEAATLSVPKKARSRAVTVSSYFAKSPSKKPRTRPVTVSPYFSHPASPSKKPKASDKVSCIPFPPLSSTRFGLVQEGLTHDPFRLLIAVTFLNKTRGMVALPAFYQLMECYATPKDLAEAKHEDIVSMIHHLGLQNQRAKKCINLAKAWLERPPEKGKRYRVLNYPNKGDGRDMKYSEIIDDADERVAWEVGQLPGCGAYAIDSWRIFCRDELRGLRCDIPADLTPETIKAEMQKEWTRVLPSDKELRAYLRWRWLRIGWAWDPGTGERKKADEGEVAMAGNGGVIYESEAEGMVVGDGKFGVAKAEDFEGTDPESEEGSTGDAEAITAVVGNPSQEVAKGGGVGDSGVRLAIGDVFGREDERKEEEEKRRGDKNCALMSSRDRVDAAR